MKFQVRPAFDDRAIERTVDATSITDAAASARLFYGARGEHDEDWIVVAPNGARLLVVVNENCIATHIVAGVL